MIGSITIHSVALSRISYGNQGVLGGPATFGAPQVASEQASLGIGVQAGLPDAPPAIPPAAISAADLSTGTLDGAKIVENSAISGSGAALNRNGSAGGAVSIAAKNQSLLKAAAALAGQASSEDPNPKPSRYFIQPASGHNWGVLHNNNGVDIANDCGASVVAAAAGKVISDPQLGSGLGGWNGGYGTFLLIEHQNGMRTRYAHLSRVLVSVGQAVEQGQQIGKIGSTGKVRGETGCHLHFEVIGGTNPFSR